MVRYFCFKWVDGEGLKGQQGPKNKGLLACHSERSEESLIPFIDFFDVF
jgi:hypothetical protein